MTFMQAVRKAQNLYGENVIVSHDHKWSTVYHCAKDDYWIFGDGGKSLIAHVDTSFSDLFVDAEKRAGVTA
jgi:hypothetical protein